MKSLQSRASSSRLIIKAGEAALVNPHALSFEGHHYDSFPTAEDTYIAESHQDISVKVWRPREEENYALLETQLQTKVN